MTAIDGLLTFTNVGKRLLIAIVLISMVLHSASRLGVLSFLYQRRHQIALTLGVIGEVPITMCDKGFDFGQGKFLAAEPDDQQVPIHLSSAQEINLFTPTPSVALSAQMDGLFFQKGILVVSTYRSRTFLDIFHPPSGSC